MLDEQRNTSIISDEICEESEKTRKNVEETLRRDQEVFQKCEERSKRAEERRKKEDKIWERINQRKREREEGGRISRS